MNELMSLWLPIIVSSVAVFGASFLMWMVLPFHKADWKSLPDEEGFFRALQSAGIGTGQYMFPCCEDYSKMKDPAFKKKWEAGPHGMLRICGRAPNFGRNLALTFLLYVVAGIFVGYLGTLALEPGAGFWSVLQVTGAAGVLAYVFASIPNAIFFGQPLKSIILNVVDGALYGVLTGVVFAWLWPGPSLPDLPVPL